MSIGAALMRYMCKKTNIICNKKTSASINYFASLLQGALNGKTLGLSK